MALAGPVVAVREALALAMEATGSISVAASVGFEDAVDELSGLSAAVVLVDASDMNGAEVLAGMRARLSAPVVGFGVPKTIETVVACARSGVDGLIGCEAPLHELTGAVHAVALGDRVWTPGVTTVLAEYFATLGPGPSSAVSPLTKREEEVAELVARGFSNKEIARALSVALPTVKTHMHHILEKLRFKHRNEIEAASPQTLGSRSARVNREQPNSKTI